MPRRPKVPLAKRQEWLVRYEKGEWYDHIARNDKVNPRTVRDGVEKARRERAFEAAQREQLREALLAHQRDLLELVERIQQTVQILPLNLWVGVRDFGLEALEPLPKTEDELDVALCLEGGQPAWGSVAHGPALAVMKRDINGPRAVQLADEDAPLWRALKEHIGSKDVLWRSLADWRRALLAEAQARAALNRVILQQAEKQFESRVGLGSSNSGRLTSGLIWFIRVEVMGSLLGAPTSDMAGTVTIDLDHLVSDQGNLEVGTLIEYPTNLDKAMAQVNDLVHAMKDRPETVQATQTYRDLESRTKKVWDGTEGYRLLHHIPGQCGVCKKLGGQ